MNCPKRPLSCRPLDRIQCDLISLDFGEMTQIVVRRAAIAAVARFGQ